MLIDMRIVVDAAMCSGHGRCAALAPEVYALDDCGYNAMGDIDVAPGLEATARVGPTTALSGRSS
jgi:ferredoxin